MALVHDATPTPSTLDLITAWLPTQPWCDAGGGPVTPVGAFRFDDPAGEVGIVSHLVRSGGRVVHVPLTYRGAELAGAGRWLVGTMRHPVLGTRWVYDGEGDPVYRDEVSRVIRCGGTQARELVATPDGPVEREPTARVRGSGAPGAADGALVLVRRPAPAVEVVAGGTLTGTWPGQQTPAALAYLFLGEAGVGGSVAPGRSRRGRSPAG
ncbi:maltokinase N-terminal cap-like domain-containing protein [Cellulosimicrobium cellulans]|uniref:maltokinase N-terminal cap-like domain-containing protein n=1 Tax=Cellulosimicrobium cellulans TaxID=1710 RepID=UPI001652332C|nr:hypothetical protein [Cellulosimicrobium cellulans]